MNKIFKTPLSSKKERKSTLSSKKDSYEKNDALEEKKVEILVNRRGNWIKKKLQEKVAAKKIACFFFFFFLEGEVLFTEIHDSFLGSVPKQKGTYTKIDLFRKFIYKIYVSNPKETSG